MLHSEYVSYVFNVIFDSAYTLSPWRNCVLLIGAHCAGNLKIKCGCNDDLWNYDLGSEGHLMMLPIPLPFTHCRAEIIKLAKFCLSSITHVNVHQLCYWKYDENADSLCESNFILISRAYENWCFTCFFVLNVFLSKF